jgi:cytochrome c oxidase cbb3-type subunit III
MSTNHSAAKSTSSGRRRRRIPWRSIAAAGLVVLAAAVAVALGARRLHRERLEQRLLAELPNRAGADPALVRFAVAEGRPLFEAHCAACHGIDMHGNTAIGAPNLTDRVWLYGRGSVYDIERTVLYGVRTGLSKSRNVTDMPAFGLLGTLDDGQIQAVVQYLFKLDGRPYQTEAAIVGREVFFSDKGDCYDCHAEDARGDTDYGAPDLTVNVWDSGGDARALYRSIYYGRHRIMPAWIGTLSLEQIRALAVFIYAVSHPESPAVRAAMGRETISAGASP